MNSDRYMALCKTAHTAEFAKDPILKSYKALSDIPLLGVEGMYVTKWYIDAVESNMGESQFKKVYIASMQNKY